MTGTSTFMKNAKSVMTFWPLVLVLVAIIAGWFKFESRTAAVEANQINHSEKIEEMAEAINELETADQLKTQTIERMEKDIGEIKSTMKNLERDQRGYFEKVLNSIRSIGQ